jgi:hypothetical protein
MDERLDSWRGCSTARGWRRYVNYDPGFFDQDEGHVEPATDPFGPEKVFTMSPE